ncbi:MAG TPA: polysaccharide biosynthesis tyrosine autokinase [Xanthobacteraceae bacterium]
MSSIARPEAPEAEHLSFDLREALYFAWRRWRFVAAVVGLALLIGGVYLMREIPRYTATAQVLLDPRKENAPGANAIMSDFSFDLAAIASQMEIIRSSVLMQRVADKERLYNDPEFGSVRAPARSWFSALFARGDPPPAPTVEGTPAQVFSAANTLKGAVNVGRTGQAYVLSISVTSIDPKRAARLANAVADAFVVDKLDARFEAAKRASGWLSDRIDELRRQLRQSEEAVATFRAEHGLVQTPTVALTEQQMSELNTRLVGARSEAAEKKTRVDIAAEFEKKGGDALKFPDLISSPLIGTLRGQLADLSRREAELSQRYNASHPELVNLRAQKSDVERAFAAEAKRVIATIRSEYELAQSREAAVEKTLQEVTGQTGLDPTNAIELRELERTAAVNRTLFEDFLQKAKVTQEESTFEVRDARVITPALPPGAPTYPNKSKVLMVAAMIGLMLGVAGAFAMEKLNAGFTTPRQIETALELPLLASVSHMREEDLQLDGKAVPLTLFPKFKPLSRYSESMRALRSGIQMTDVDDPPKVIQVTSTLPDEGKTTLALSLAASAATSGLSVLLVDADLRHPSASREAGAKNTLGLVDLLLGKVDLKEAVRFSERNGFWILPAGSKTQNPPDLLGSERMKALIEGFRKSFDYVVIDTAPLGPVVDPIVVSQRVDKVVLVVRWAATAREMVHRSVQQLSGHKTIAGIVFNFVRESQAQKYGKYAYYYGGRYYKNYYTE